MVYKQQRKCQNKFLSTRIYLLVFNFLIGVCASLVQAAQLPDNAYVPIIPDPQHTPAPIVMFDHGHMNANRVDDRYIGFRDFLTTDGYNVRSINEKADNGSGFRHYFSYTDSITGLPIETDFQRERAKANILVICNATAPGTYFPYVDALRDYEVEAVRDWVAAGGSLLLILDHQGLNHVRNLLNAFGVDLIAGVLYSDTDTSSNVTANGMFLKSDNTLTSNSVLTSGVDYVRSFFGSGLSIVGQTYANAAYEPIMTFGSDATYSHGSAEGYYQGIAIRYGAGRVYISGEAAMFSAQYQTTSSGGFKSYMGMNFDGQYGEDARFNAQFLRNIMHWLDGSLSDSTLDSNGPNLVVTSVTGTTNRGGKLPIAYTVCNLGTTASPVATSASIYLSRDNLYSATDRLVALPGIPPLQARECFSGSQNVGLSGLANTTYYLIGVADAQSQVSETDESRNIYTGGVVQLHPSSDLMMTEISGDSTGHVGGSMSITYQACNLGTDTAGDQPFDIAVYLSTDDVITTGDYLLFSQTVDPLPISGCYGSHDNDYPSPITVAIPVNIPPGEYKIGAIVDPSGLAAEGDESNNYLLGNTVMLSP